jgi:hypothetical protein
MPKHRTGCAGLRHHGAGNARPHELTPRSHRRDAAWRAHVHGTTILPMEEPAGFFARLFGGGRR